MAEKIELEVSLKDLGEQAKKANLTPAQRESYSAHANKAQLALDTKDYKLFQKHFNSMVNILKDAVGASKDVSQALKDAIKLKDDLAKKINKLRDQQGEIKSTITKEGKLKATKAQSLYSEHARYSKVKDANGKQISSYGTAAENASKITVSAQKITNEIAKAAGFADKAAAQAAVAIMKEIEAVRQKAITEQPQVEAKLEEAEQQQAQQSEEVDRLTASSTTSATAITELYKAIDELGNKTNATITEMRNEEKIARSGNEEAFDPVQPKAIEKQSSSLGKAFKQFTLYAVAVRSAKRALNEAKKTIIDLDKYLTEQAMVTGKTRKQTYELLKQYQALARELGTTTKEVAEVATQYMRQGKTAEDALKLTEAAVSAAKVAGISAAESVQYLTTALNGFQLSANDAMQVSDKFAAIAAQSASSYEELAIALSKVASQANLAGMSIDYTTALLAKGLETTREAPETIGTALKTVIARMREMGDYGETLEGDTDVNNVETQLAYVNIALKNQNGELRSTEEVLDELGRKWNTLSVNQQAAVAKALAGTRQQSRLIAMMQDYERVTELQQISQRSAGATLAQMETYLQGMDAALNKLNNAWERIVTTITNSDAIISIIDQASKILNNIADLFKNDIFLIGTIITLGTLLIGHLVTKYEMQKANNRAVLEEKKAKLETNKVILKEKLAEAQRHRQILESNKANKDGLITELKKLKANAEEKGNAVLVAKYTKEIALAEKDKLDTDKAIKQAKAEELAASAELKANNIAIWQTDLQISQNAAGLTSVVTSLLAPLGAIVGLVGTVFSVVSAINTAKVASIALEKKNQGEIAKTTLLEKIKAAWSMASSAGAIPFIGWGIALAILAAIGIALAVNAANASSSEAKIAAATEKINELSATIYNLQKTSDALQSIESKFDAIDNKVVKTNADLQEMTELLASASDSMKTTKANGNESDLKKARKAANKGKATQEQLDLIESADKFGGLSEKEWYDAKSDADKRRYLAEKQAGLQRELDEARKKQLDTIKIAIQEGAKAEDYKAEVTALTNAQIYKQIDALEELTDEQKKATESIAQSLTDNMSASEQLKYLNDPSKLKGLINRIDKGAAVALTSDMSTLSEKIEAYRKITGQLQGEELTAFQAVYRQFNDLVNIIDSSGGKVLDYIEKLGISNDKINDLHDAFGDQYLGVLESLSAYTDVETGVVDLQEVIRANFGEMSKDSEKYINTLNALEKTIGESMLNIGQSITKTSNQINTVYETALKWSTMSAADQGSFLSENSKLFQNNPELYRAFQTGDLAAIETALRRRDASGEMTTLQSDIQNEIRTINSQLAVERARSEKDRNEFLIQYLEDQLAMLEDEENFYKASLDVRLDLEQKQLDIYKEYLQKQQDALTSALEKRKDAYQEYFDAINQEEEDEEYEKQANLLATNLSKLTSSDNAASKQQTKELEKQLQDLEEERLKELRQRAQEAVLQNLDDQVEEINKKFDKLLESNQNLLAAMLNDEADKDDFIANMISSSINGMTANEAQKWLSEDFTTTFGSMLPKEALTQIEKSMSEVLNLNVNGGNVMISEQQQKNLYKIIMDALQQIGYN